VPDGDNADPLPLPAPDLPQEPAARSGDGVPCAAFSWGLGTWNRLTPMKLQSGGEEQF